MQKEDVKTRTKNGLSYLLDDGGRIRRFTPWLGDAFAFLYDRIMEKSIFPKKFGGDIGKHFRILKEQLEGIHGKRVLELATGSGSAARFLAADNVYTGTDISPGLLKRALKNLGKAGFKDTDFYVTGADNLPFEDNSFDVCLCILALNFFPDAKGALNEARRVLTEGGILVCCVPVPERNKLRSTIRGTLCSAEKLGRMCQECGLGFEALPHENGALLYSQAQRAAAQRTQPPGNRR